MVQICLEKITLIILIRITWYLIKTEISVIKEILNMFIIIIVEIYMIEEIRIMLIIKIFMIEESYINSTFIIVKICKVQIMHIVLMQEIFITLMLIDLALLQELYGFWKI